MPLTKEMRATLPIRFPPFASKRGEDDFANYRVGTWCPTPKIASFLQTLRTSELALTDRDYVIPGIFTSRRPDFPQASIFGSINEDKFSSLVK